MEHRGLESLGVTDLNDNELRKTAFASNTESNTVGDDSGEIEPELKMIIKHWNDLSEKAKSEILQIIKSDRHLWK